MSAQQMKRLLDALLDGELDEADLPRLEAALQRDAGLRRRFWQESRLRQELAGELAERVSRRPWRRPALLVAAAVLLLGGGVWLAMRQSGADGAQSIGTVLACPDGSRLRLEPGGSLQRQDADDGLVYQLEHGTVHADVVARRDRGPFVIVGQHLRAEVLGTRFTLQTDADATALRVHEGVVRWHQRDVNQTGLVRAGQEHLVYSAAATASLQELAGGMGDIAPGDWQPLDLDAPEAWQWVEPRLGHAQELLVAFERPRPAACMAIAFAQASTQARRVWLDGAATVCALPAGDPIDAAAWREAAMATLAPDADGESLTVVLIAYRHLGKRYARNWFEVQIAAPGSQVQCFLALGAVGRWPSGVRVAGPRRAGLLPAAAAWRPLPTE